MPGRTNLKAVPDVKPEKMSYEQIDRLARALAYELMQEDRALGILMLLMQEIAEHPYDHSHVETVANLVNTRAFAVTPEADTASRQFIAGARLALIGAKGGSE
jgi:hypothetical protein